MKTILITLALLIIAIAIIAFFSHNKPITVTHMPSLSLNSVTSVKVGDTFDVVVTAATQQQLIDGLDVLLKLSPGLQVLNYTPTNLLPVHNFSTTVPDLGNFAFSQLTNGGQHLAVNGVIATLEVKAVAEGTQTIQFDFTPGSTRDTNLASPQGTDILDDVTNLAIQVEPINPVIIPTPMTPELLAAIQALATEFKVEIAGTVTPAPVAPTPVPFDVKPA